MKIFLDCSDAELVRTYYETGLVDGVTTNPSLMLKAGKNPKDVYKEISDIFPFHASISAEVVGETAEDMLDMAEDLIDIGPNITIKVPCTPQGLKACKELSEDEVNVNVTLIFSAAQAILAAKAGATYVSPFVGRVFDQSFDGIGLIEEISDIFATHGAKTQVLAASIRETYQVAQAFKVGADICTIPSKVFESMFQHVLTDKGLDIFDKDWKKLQSELGTT
jgi:transaldolase|tara:strand:+ start:1107 stop:1772 length:666 start_codon:yes stop_codon:yes gene_type:complete